MFSSKEDNVETEVTTSLLSNFTTTSKTLDNATTSFSLTTGYLDSKESKTYTLRLWIDENVGPDTEDI